MDPRRDDRGAVERTYVEGRAVRVYRAELSKVVEGV